MNHPSSVGKSLLAGAVGGLAASFVMTQFQSLWAALSDAKPRGGEDATVKTAKAVSMAVADHSLTRAEKKWAGPAVHYAFGTLTGAVYGALAETIPATAACRGTAFGTAVWLAADEVAVPALGLSKPPTESPVDVHIEALASHIVYGFTTDLAWRTLRRWFA